MEMNLVLLGATGVEDKLQDQVVPTIEKLQRAGMTTWMLTGDKKETAINMALASGMVMSSDKQIDLCNFIEVIELYSMVNELHETLDEWSFYANGTYIVLNNKIISAIQKSNDCKAKMSDVFSKCKSVVACRLSPIQKSQLVIMMKNANVQNITCAIGDGGNDVSMIQEAHVGLGNVGSMLFFNEYSHDFSYQMKHGTILLSAKLTSSCFASWADKSILRPAHNTLSGNPQTFAKNL